MFIYELTLTVNIYCFFNLLEYLFTFFYSSSIYRIGLQTRRRLLFNSYIFHYLFFFICLLLQFLVYLFACSLSIYSSQIYRSKYKHFTRRTLSHTDLCARIAFDQSRNSLTERVTSNIQPASMIAPHPDDARNYLIDMCWSRKGIKGPVRAARIIVPPRPPGNFI